MLKEFREFAMRGNVVDMAVGIVIGGAFGTIVKSLVDDVLMPPVGLLLGGVDFSEFFITLKGPAEATLEAAKKSGAVTLNWGLFINSVISFVIVAFALFMVIKAMNEAKRRMESEQEEEAAAPAEPPRSEVLLEEIRDALVTRG
ncbi:MAG: large-conductance mechanosensitive channel protein MscL [Methyloligellaceae bacterium]